MSEWKQNYNLETVFDLEQYPLGEEQTSTERNFLKKLMKRDWYNREQREISYFCSWSNGVLLPKLVWEVMSCTQKRKKGNFFTLK